MAPVQRERSLSSCWHHDAIIHPLNLVSGPHWEKMAKFFVKRQPVTCIQDLPIEMHMEIWEKLSLHELVVNSSKTCHQWRDDIAQHILAPKILALAEVNEKFKMDIKEKGWAEEQANNTTELIMSLYDNYEHFTSKYFFC